jgi:hypothetical protein
MLKCKRAFAGAAETLGRIRGYKLIVFSGISTKIGHSPIKHRSPGMELATRTSVKWTVSVQGGISAAPPL